MFTDTHRPYGGAPDEAFYWVWAGRDAEHVEDSTCEVVWSYLEAIMYYHELRMSGWYYTFMKKIDL